MRPAISPTNRRSPAPRLVCLAIASALTALSAPAFAAPEPAATAGATASASADGGTGAGPDYADRPTRLDSLEVTGDAVDRPSSVKYTEPLLDTPQTITVIDRRAMDQQGLVSLTDMLSTLPGITFGAGEGGGGYGDSINLRGFSATSDITVDGVRDSAQYSRTDNFNLEALELVNGANSVNAGAGSVGGNINLVSKTAQAANFTTLTVGAGSDEYGRVTADSNRLLSGDTALRLNAMVHRNDVAGRDHERFERWGFAPSLGFGLDGATRFTLSALVQRDDNLPQYGVPYYPAYGGLPPGVDGEGYFGYHNVDTQEIAIDQVTGVFEHDFSDAMTLRSLLRFQDVEQLSIANPVQGTFCLADGTNPATGLACSGANTTPGTFLPSGPRGTTRDADTRMATSQTDLTARFDTGGVEHALVVGLALTREDYALDNGNVQRNPDGSVPTYPLMDLSDPDSFYTGPLNYIRSGATDASLDSTALYAFDTLKFGERWHLNLGARWENIDGDLRTRTFATPAAGGGVLTEFRDTLDEDLFSWRAGVVFKPSDIGTIYLSHANSVTPSRTAVNGSCNEFTCNTDPEDARIVELGTKWELFDRRLALTAAVFRNERENYRLEAFDAGGLPMEFQNDGRARVDGVTLGLAGDISDRWSLFANATWLDSEILQGVSDACLENPGQGSCDNTPADPDPTRGDVIPNTPDRSASVWTTFDLADAWTLGYGLTYQGSFDGGRVAGLPDVPSYTTHRAMLAWQATDQLALQLNVFNLTDEDYFTRVRVNGWATPGESRSFVLNATYQF